MPLRVELPQSGAGMPIDQFNLPNIEVWYKRLCDRPAFQRQVLE